MRKNTRFTCQMLLVLGLLSIIPAGCGSSEIDIFPAKQVLDYPLIGTSDISTLDPAFPTDMATTQAIELVFSGLVSLDPKTLKSCPTLPPAGILATRARPTPSTCAAGSSSPMATRWMQPTFAYSIDRALDPATKSLVATVYLGHIVGANARNAGKLPTVIGTGVVVVDPQTLQINLDSPISFFLEALTYQTSWAVDQKVVQQYGANWADGHAIGSGPFILKSWRHKVQLTFVQNPNWYGKKLTLTEIDMPMISDTGTAFKSFQAKELDIDNLVDSANYSIAKGFGPSRFFEGPALSSGISPLTARFPRSTMSRCARHLPKRLIVIRLPTRSSTALSTPPITSCHEACQGTMRA